MNSMPTRAFVLTFNRLMMSAAAGALAFASPVLADPGQRALSVQLAPQSLGSALNKLAAQSSSQLVVDGRLTRGLRSRPLRGNYTLKQALDQLLRGTGLSYRSSGDTVIIERTREFASLQPAALGRPTAPGEQPVVVADPGTNLPPSSADVVTSPGEPKRQGEIIVTGSRLGRTGYTQPSPVNVINAQALQESGFSNVSDVLNRLPQVAVGLGSANSYYNSDAGASFINLRGLGTNRTLVLVNGRRRVSGTELSSAVDVTTIPANLIDRIEVITGGAAAVYGADAVSGVVNITLKQKYDGIELTGKSGISSLGDDATRSIGVIFGKPLGDRGSFLIGGSYNTEDPLQANQRSFGQRQVALFSNPANTGPNDGIYDAIAIANYRYPGTSYGGAFVIGNTRYTYGQNGVRPTQNDSTPYGPLGFLGVGGDGFNDADFAPLRNKSRVFASVAHLDYEVADKVKFFFDGQYARSKTVAPLQPTFDLGITLPISNPLIPQDVRSLMVQAGQNTLTIGRTNIDQGIAKRYVTRNTETGVGGLEGDLGSFHWTGFFQYGRNEASFTKTHDRIVSRFNDAVDVITGPSGAPECASATARAAGCQPLDLFGEYAATPSALSYFDYTVRRSVVNTQQVAGLQITGKPIELPAGAVQIAAGAEDRRETLTVHPDAMAAEGLLLNSVDAPVHASFHVKELFGETLIPIVANLPFVKSLSVEGAARYSDYNTTGSTWAWKLGAQYAPSSDIRFRVTRSKSVRAPSLAELYDPGSSSNAFIIDPCTNTNLNLSPNRATNCAALGVPANYVDPLGGVAKTIITSGNANLRPETSLSWTAGAVFTPGAIPGLAASVDWYSIKIANAINTPVLQQLVDNCVDASSSANPFCALITRRSDGAISSVNVAPINISKLTAEGVDFQASYSHRIGTDFFAQDNRVRLALSGTYVIKNDQLVVSSDPTSLIRNEGSIDDPRWRFNLTPGFSAGPFSLDWTLRYISRSKVDVQASAEARSDNNVAARLYNDVYVNLAVNKRFSIYAGVNNLFDVTPPFSAETFQGTGRGALYDNIGRYLFVGIDAKL